MKYLRHSPSALNLFAASPSMFVLERIIGRRQPVGAPAHRGTAVEAGITAGLLAPGMDPKDCGQHAIATFDRLTALSADPRILDHRRDIPAMVAAGLEELRPYGIPSATQGAVTWHPPELKYPIFGYFDFYWEDLNIVVDLKTTDKMPSAIKISHARQVAFYKSQLGDNSTARISYVTPKKRTTYHVENAREHLSALFKIALACERFLALSDDPAFFKSITAPDLESFYWNSPQARQAAFEEWAI
jgi:hypothetical protein